MSVLAGVYGAMSDSWDSSLSDGHMISPPLTIWEIIKDIPRTVRTRNSALLHTFEPYAPQSPSTS